VGLDDGVVPGGDVLEVGEEPKHLLDRSPDHHGVLEGGHTPLLSDAESLAACIGPAGIQRRAIPLGSGSQLRRQARQLAHRNLNCACGVFLVHSWAPLGRRAGRMPHRRPILYSLIPGCRGASREQSCEHRGFRSRPVADAFGAPVLRGLQRRDLITSQNQ
jgi:hypothetical protein